MEKGLRIFATDRQFILFFSNLLLGAGFFSLFFVLMCKLMGMGLCEKAFIPIFGGFRIIRQELALYNLPLAMIILGIGMRVFTAFGWFACVSLASILLIGFSYMAFFAGE